MSNMKKGNFGSEEAGSLTAEGTAISQDEVTRPPVISSPDRAPTTGSTCSNRSGLRRRQEDLAAKRKSLPGTNAEVIAARQAALSASPSGVCSLSRWGLQRNQDEMQAKRRSLPGTCISPPKPMDSKKLTRHRSLVPKDRGLSAKLQKKLIAPAQTDATTPVQPLLDTNVPGEGPTPPSLRSLVTLRGLGKNNSPAGEPTLALGSDFMRRLVGDPSAPHRPSLPLPSLGMAPDRRPISPVEGDPRSSPSLVEPEIVLSGYLGLLQHSEEPEIALPVLSSHNPFQLQEEPEISLLSIGISDDQQQGQGEQEILVSALSSLEVSEHQQEVQYDQETLALQASAIGHRSSTPNREVLVEARIVLEEELQHNLTEATEVDPDSLERREHVKAKGRECRWIGFCIIAVSLSIIIGSVFVAQTNQKTTYKEAAHKQSSPRAQRPTQSPSWAPTGVLDDFLSNLPQATVDRINRPNTPQANAYARLQSHPHSTGLPLWKQVQLFAMTTFFFSMRGPHWPQALRQSWMDSTKDECLWFSGNYGVLWYNGTWEPFDIDHPYRRETCNEQGEVEVLHISDLHLSNHVAFIPPEITLLSSLKSFNLEMIEFNQSMADLMSIKDLASVSTLTELSLFLNFGLNGQIPADVGLLSRLTYLRFSVSGVSGLIPSQIGLLKDLQELSLAGGGISGTIPSQVWQLTNLETLFLNSNSLTGTIHSGIETMTNLRWFYIDNNNLSGRLPTELGLLRSLQTLMASSNLISGSIPNQLEGSCLKSRS